MREVSETGDDSLVTLGQALVIGRRAHRVSLTGYEPRVTHTHTESASPCFNIHRDVSMCESLNQHQFICRSIFSQRERDELFSKVRYYPGKHEKLQQGPKNGGILYQVRSSSRFSPPPPPFPSWVHTF